MTDQSTKQSVVDKVPLNQVQREAILYDSGPQLVFAGAGTGKTRVLTAKIAFLIEQKNISPANIFAATFTNKAAQEMRERVERLIGIPCDGLWIGTFHSLCAKILRRESHRLGYTPSFTIYDSDDQIACVKKVLKELSLDERAMPPRQVLSAISAYKNSCIAAEDIVIDNEPYWKREVVRCYQSYSRMLKLNNAMDFDDLIGNAVLLFKRYAEVLVKYQSLFKYVLVDEYQDTNTAQFFLVKSLAAAHNRIFVVGDDDQGIYGWRGANIDNILSFEKIFPDTKVFKLEQNYRSTQHILNLANEVISHNSKRAEKRLFTSRNSPHPVTVTRYRDDRHEADDVGDLIKQIMREKNLPGSNFCVLFRTNAQSRSFEEAFRKKQLPYILVGTVSFFERKEIKDCMAYLRLLTNPADDVSFERIMNVPARGLGEKAYDQLAALAKEKRIPLLTTVLTQDLSGFGRSVKAYEELRSLFTTLNTSAETTTHGVAICTPAELLQLVLTETGYVDKLQDEDSEESRGRLENINELLNTLAVWTNDNPEKSLAEFLQEISLLSDIDSWQNKDDAVNCMTLHCAKGLEFKVVFLVGCEDGILPSRMNFDDNEKMAEERRLMYVGITRAMDELYCSYAEQRWRFGSITPMSTSRFLEAIPETFFSYRDKTVYESARPAPTLAARRDFSSSSRMQTTSYRPKTYSNERGMEGFEPPPPVSRRDEFDSFSQDIVTYRMGQVVGHKVYGKGKIVAISGFGKDMRLTILFNDGVRRKLMASFAQLEKGFHD